MDAFADYFSFFAKYSGTKFVTETPGPASLRLALRGDYGAS